MGFDWKKFKDGDRFKFVNPGDKIEGKLVQISVTDFGGQAEPTPELHLQVDDDTVMTVTASQAVLCSRLAEAAPDVGDHVSITYDGEDPKGGRPGRSPAKLFTVVVKPANGAGAPPPPPPPPPPASLPPVPGYPPPTAADMANPAYVEWYEANAPKAPAPPPPPPFDPADEPF